MNETENQLTAQMLRHIEEVGSEAVLRSVEVALFGASVKAAMSQTEDGVSEAKRLARLSRGMNHLLATE